MTRWGVVATIFAPTVEILEFAAFHLDAGAHRLYIYLDDPASAAYSLLKAHPKIRVQRCDEAYWRKSGGKRPVKHQVRQSQNATHAYHRKTEVDWLAHIDVDEFIVPEQEIGASLSELSSRTHCARLRPIEQLAGDGNHFKAFIPNGPSRIPTVAQIYPEFGKYLKGGFLSHVAGKLFVRTGLEDIEFRIHNIFQQGTSNPHQIELTNMTLAHCHAKPWNEWLKTFQFRLEKGSYRSELSPASKNEFSLHELLQLLHDSEGNAGLKRFFDEVALDSAPLRQRLDELELLQQVDLRLDAKLARHFPDFT